MPQTFTDTFLRRSCHFESQLTWLYDTLKVPLSATMTSYWVSCKGVLEDLNSLIENYLASGDTYQALKRVHSRIKDVTALKARLISNTTLFNGFIQRFDIPLTTIMYIMLMSLLQLQVAWDAWNAGTVGRCSWYIFHKLKGLLYRVLHVAIPQRILKRCVKAFTRLGSQEKWSNKKGGNFWTYLGSKIPPPPGFRLLVVRTYRRERSQFGTRLASAGSDHQWIF